MNPMQLFDSWREFSRRRSEDKARMRTVSAISDLPPYLLKDIGWPSAYERRRAR